MSEQIPLLFVPGLLCDHALWQHQIQDLSDIADCHVAETKLHNRIADMTSHILAEAPSEFALAGLSMGGYISMEIMRQAPERVLKLALIATRARQDPEESQKTRRGLISLAQRGRFTGVSPRLMPMFVHPDRLEDAELTATISEMAQRIGKDAFIRQQEAILDRCDSREDLPDYRCPTLIICGREDLVTPLALHEEMRDLIPQTDFHILEKCGHLPPLEHPQQVSQLLRHWLLSA